MTVISNELAFWKEQAQANERLERKAYEEIARLITTIESQKEEIEKFKELLIGLLPNVRGLEIVITSEIERLSHETP